MGFSLDAERVSASAVEGPTPVSSLRPDVPAVAERLVDGERVAGTTHVLRVGPVTAVTSE